MGNAMQNLSQVLPPAILPGHPPTPCPELLTSEEAVRYLRLDKTAIKDDNHDPDELLDSVYTARQFDSPLFKEHNFYG